VKIEELIGKTLTEIEGGIGSSEIVLVSEDGKKYSMHHDQDCCETVELNDICGDLADLTGSPILKAEESENSESDPEGFTPDEYRESFTWTFYRLSTIKGTVVLRWYGTSNGYYSESISLEEVANG